MTLPTTEIVIIISLMTSLQVDVTVCDYRVLLKPMSSLKIPTYDVDGEEIYRFDPGSVNKMSFDGNSKLLYVVGGSHIHYVNVTDPYNLRVIGHTSLPDVNFHDVETCGDHVIATYTTFNKSGLLVAKGYNPAYQFPIILLKTIHDTSEPVSLSMTSDCQTAVVAVSGKALWEEEEFHDKQPAVLLVSMSAILARAGSADTEDPVTLVDFRQLNEMADELEEGGVRFPMKNWVGSLSQDLDPKHVTIDDVTRKAYVTLQVNNAIAEIDLEAKNISRVIPLGLKDWTNQDIDVSDRDGILFQRYGIYSMYQAGVTSLLRHDGASFLLTANTGAKRDYSDMIMWSEVRTGRQLVDEDFVDNSVEPEFRDALRNTSKLGALKFTIRNGHDGLNASGLTKFQIFGARSFSMRSIPDLDLVYDSGSDVEHIMADKRPDVFNSPVLKGFNFVQYDSDMASVDMGPAPSVVTSGRLGSLSLVFVGLGNPGGVLAYSLALGSQRPRFEYMLLDLETSLGSWDTLYTQQRPLLAGITVTDLSYVPSHVTRSGFPWLLVAGSKSGTISCLEVRGAGDVPEFGSSSGSSHALYMVTICSLMLYVMTMTSY